jgi:hypothetical protein
VGVSRLWESGPRRPQGLYPMEGKIFRTRACEHDRRRWPMARRISAAVMLANLLTVTAPALAGQFLCVPDKATGFYYNRSTKEWDYAKLQTNKFMISPANDGQNAYTVTKIGAKDVPGSCKNDFNNAGVLFCRGWGTEIKFNRGNKRYVRVYWAAYYNVGIPGPFPETDEDSGTPLVEIGKCAPF